MKVIDYFEFNEKHRFEKIPESLRSKVFGFLGKLPNASSPILYNIFGAKTEIDKALLRKYRIQYFDKNRLEVKMLNIKEPAILISWKEYQDQLEKKDLKRIKYIKNMFNNLNNRLSRKETVAWLENL